MLKHWEEVNLQEECAEVIQAVSKILRFGLHQPHPVTGETNKSQLEEEMGQLRYMLDVMETKWNLDPMAIKNGYMKKASTLDKWKDYYQEISVE